MITYRDLCQQYSDALKAVFDCIPVDKRSELHACQRAFALRTAHDVLPDSLLNTWHFALRQASPELWKGLADDITNLIDIEAGAALYFCQQYNIKDLAFLCSIAQQHLEITARQPRPELI